MPSPRPILKTSPSPTATTPLPCSSSRAPVCGSLHVHFPPTPTMTQTDLTHSSFSYDRKSITVLPNTCALPGRGERDVDTLPDPECEVELWALVHRKKKVKGGRFRTYEALEAESAEGDLPEQFSSSLLFANSSSSSSLSSLYRMQNDTLCDKQPHVRSVQFVGSMDTSDTGSYSSTSGSLYTQMDACQFIQNIPHMDLSLPFMPRKQPMVHNKAPQVKEKECPGPLAHKERSAPAAAPMARSNHFERTRKVVYNAGCGGFGSGLYDSSGLDGCLGGF